MIPNAVEKRDILFGVKKVTSAQLLAFAQGYEKAEMLNDAAEFYHQLKSNEDLRRVSKLAESEGDVFLWLKVHRWIGDAQIDQDALTRCTAKAEATGKFRYAILGHEKLGNEAAANALKEQLKDDGDFQAIAEAQVFLAENPQEILENDEGAEE